MAPKPRPKSTSATVRTGWRPDLVPAAEPEGQGGEAVKVISWGNNNLLPQDAVRLIYDSGTAEACYDTLYQFIGGEGFADEATALLRVNPTQTLNDLLAEARHYAALGLGFGLIIRYTYGGEPAEYYVAETDSLRKERDRDPLEGPNRWVLNYKLADGKMPVAENHLYLPHDPLASQEDIAEEVMAAALSEAGYWGHLVFHFERKVSRRHYPVPSWYAGKEDLESDAATSKYERKQVKNGFFPDAWLTVIGKKYDDQPDPDFTPGEGQTMDDAPYIESEDFANIKTTLKNLKGSETEASVGVSVAETKDEVPDLKFFDKGPNSKGLTDMTNRLVNKVCRHMGVPPVLIGVAEAGMLGNNQQIVNSIKLFNIKVKAARALITDTLQKFFPELDLTVKPLNPVDYLDPAVAAKMTEDEIRAFGGLPALKKPQSTEAEVTLQALNSMSPLVANEVLKSFSQDEIRALVGKGPKVAAKPRPKA
ncbi:hypothetical protein [Hymenobacter glacieicola]|uniref:Phage portal protein n=1 Tax=Hymenobacter glacieicola TaxID=1562124 RepID=A0ABQ1WNQ3_9BACT|nr:hypothetical protein [Hymenobacter glacieicola]GGG34233.1 hypothetical protein GCM10011378_08310 [Hymenobacter glacieicola]